MEKSTLKDVSKEFGMDANEFAEQIGYTPQAFNAALRTGEANRTRMSGVLNQLKEISNRKYMQDIKASGNRRSRREQVIRQLTKWFGISLD